MFSGPDLLGDLDDATLARSIEAAVGPAAVQGVRDALAARGKGASQKAQGKIA